jgi:hypothetical protein
LARQLHDPVVFPIEKMPDVPNLWSVDFGEGKNEQIFPLLQIERRFLRRPAVGNSTRLADLVASETLKYVRNMNTNFNVQLNLTQVTSSDVLD